LKQQASSTGNCTPWSGWASSSG